MPLRIASRSLADSTAALSLTSVSTPLRSAGAVVATVSKAQCATQPRHPSVSQASANFSTTASLEKNSKPRRMFMEWARTHGKKFAEPSPEAGPNYLDSQSKSRNRPFPQNPFFRSSEVLDEDAREMVWSRIIRQGESVKAVSAELGIDVTRVAAVVRLKEVEKDFIAKGKKLAIPYSRAVLRMVPTTTYFPGRTTPHEAINEVHIHSATMNQLFWPTSESREFTRYDAAKAFHHRMLPADARVPVPELIQMEKDLLEGVSPAEAKQRFLGAAEESEQKAAAAERERATALEAATTRVKGSRHEFRFRDFNSENVGPKGRRIRAVGSRYGVPSYDRAKGRVKIPTSVP